MNAMCLATPCTELLEAGDRGVARVAEWQTR